MPRGAPKGTRYGGRQKGQPNKMTADLRAAITQAFDESGGVEYLKEVAMTDKAVFCTLLGKVIPKEVSHTFTNLADELQRARQRALQAATTQTGDDAE